MAKELDTPSCRTAELMLAFIYVSSLLLTAGILTAQEPSDAPALMAPYFHELRRLRFNEVYHRIDDANAKTEERWRHVTFGLAVAGLNRQPRSGKTVGKSERLFEAVQFGNRGDDLGVASAYFLARIVQIHRLNPDQAEAARMFRALSEEFPNHYFGQMAFLNYATITIYQQLDVEEISAALYRLEEEGQFLSIREIQRNFYRLMGETHVYYDVSRKRGEDFFIAAMEIGFDRAALRAKMLLRIAELARSRGDRTAARSYYERLLAEFTRSRYRYITQKRLESLLTELEGAD